MKFAKGFLCGVIVCGLLAGSVIAFAADTIFKTISVTMGGVNIVVDGETVIPRDANGKVIDVLGYNGSAYLPVRALTDAITKGTKPIEWEAITQTIYIGEKKPNGAAVWLDSLTPYDKDPDISKATGTFKVRQTTYSPEHCFNIISAKYLLKSRYKTIKGYIASADNAGAGAKAYLRIYDSSNGNTKLLFEKTCSGGVEPIPFEVSMSGVDQIFIDFYGEIVNGSYTYDGRLFNVQLIEEGEADEG